MKNQNLITIIMRHNNGTNIRYQSSVIKYCTFYIVWKVSKCGRFFVPYFPVFSPNVRKYGPKKKFQIYNQGGVNYCLLILNSFFDKLFFVFTGSVGFSFSVSLFWFSLIFVRFGYLFLVHDAVFFCWVN